MHKVFFSLEKFRAKQKTICRLKTTEGEFISDQESILKECRLFYQQLYDKNKNVDPNNYTFFYENSELPKLNSQERLSCENDLTLEELYKTLKCFKKISPQG